MARSETSPLCHKTILCPFMDNGVPGMAAGAPPAHPCSLHHPLSPQQPRQNFANPPGAKRDGWQNPESPGLDPTSPMEQFSM